MKKPEIVLRGSGMDAHSAIAGLTALDVVSVMKPASTSESRLVAWDHQHPDNRCVCSSRM
jgi:hypothetical protein